MHRRKCRTALAGAALAKKWRNYFGECSTNYASCCTQSQGFFVQTNAS
jgi:hypothetical protein